MIYLKFFFFCSILNMKIFVENVDHAKTGHGQRQPTRRLSGHQRTDSLPDVFTINAVDDVRKKISFGNEVSRTFQATLDPSPFPVAQGSEFSATSSDEYPSQNHSLHTLDMPLPPARMSVSTPPPSALTQINNEQPIPSRLSFDNDLQPSSPTTCEHRKSWYKTLIKLDRLKGKNKPNGAGSEQSQDDEPRTSSLDYETSVARSPVSLKARSITTDDEQPPFSPHLTSDSKTSPHHPNHGWAPLNLSSDHVHQIRQAMADEEASQARDKDMPLQAYLQLKNNRRYSLDDLRKHPDYHLYQPQPSVAKDTAVAFRPNLKSTRSPEVNPRDRVAFENLSDVEETIPSVSSSIHNEEFPVDQSDFEDPTDVNSSDSGQSHEKQVEKGQVLLFDYDTLPEEVVALINEYEKEGKVQMKERRIKDTDGSDRQTSKDEDENDEDEELDLDNEEDDEDDVIDAANIISGLYTHANASPTDKKTIAVVQVDPKDKSEFVKLVQMTGEEVMDNGPLIDLHVSLLGPVDDKEQASSRRFDDIEATLRMVGGRLEELARLSQESQQFLNDRWDVTESLALDMVDHAGHETTTASGDRKSGSPQALFTEEPEDYFAGEKASRRRSSSLLSSFNGKRSSSVQRLDRSSGRYSLASMHRAPSLLLNNIPFRSVNPFDYRQEGVRLSVEALQTEMTELKQALTETEVVVRDVQFDMATTRNRMETYIKDIPETHYSALKKLEVDIESILANRAKSPWLDTGYTLLSYFLTLFAIGVWIVICLLKWIRKVILFPQTLWITYSEYLVERDKAVKKASKRSLASGIDRKPSYTNHHDPQTRSTDSMRNRTPLHSSPIQK
ncbi:uncharacterized protein BYT42DRAFT_362258 [Radiomyces spectabilis]|uniref:uncharacterized protein n=1 Tax=Radiomyces spectabilis TaxID=64574 RepID=UPI0022210464|nr:uncharacterized protein BYT42DRAFT_362258 [Radiomyces spectabilis]KAI8377933.1 hypothetical protein BYT42DRAFT_362258 [Radiomyces spectabilis]